LPDESNLKMGRGEVSRSTVHHRIILHIDMDCFYAAIEMSDFPEYANKPVIVGADPRGGMGRGVVSTCSYEARNFGVRSAMPIRHAYHLCPNAVYLRPRMDRYAEVSDNIMGILKNCGFPFEQVSIDEAFLDLSCCKTYSEAREVATQLKYKIRSVVGITSSIGIGPTKTVAKIASDFKKPDGLTIVEPLEVERFLAPLPVRKIPGIGPKTESELQNLGVRTIGDLSTCNIQELIGRFGRNAASLREAALGIDESSVTEREGILSLSKETTFEQDTDNPDEIVATLNILAEELFQSLKQENLYFKTVTVRLRTWDLVTRTKSKTLDHYHNDQETIQNIGHELLREIFEGQKIRRVGLKLSGLKQKDTRQKTLFDL